MSILTDKKTGRLFIQFDYQGETYKKRLPAGTTYVEADKLETKLKHDLYFSDHLPKKEEKQIVTFKSFAEEIYLPYVKANNSPQALEKAIVILKAARANIWRYADR